jgi:dTDP-4-amino-4,6-dideoxygalactose transaminase
MNVDGAARIPILDLSDETRDLWDELSTAILDVVRSGRFIMGPDVRAFETEVAGYLGARHAIGVNSGTDALVIALRALGVGPGDEVVTTPFSFFATAESISAVGATPVFVDIDPETFNIDPGEIEAAIGPRTKAVLPVHLFGRPAEIDAIVDLANEHGLAVVEDCAQSFGATVRGRKTGTFGAAGAFSFFPTKNLGAFGDGGLVVTDDDAVADAARMLRVHGARTKYHNEVVGYNSRLDSIQAAVLRVKLPHVDRANRLRREAALRYRDLLADVSALRLPEVPENHVFHQFTVRVVEGDRDELASFLEERGIATMVYYPIPQDRLPAYAGAYPRFPNSDAVAGQVLSLPVWPGIAEEVQRRVADAIDAWRP